jgi:hypothetical protein
MPNLGTSVFAPSPKLGADLPLDPAGKHALVFSEKNPHGLSIPLDERPERPRECLDHHIVAILNNLAADGQSTANVPAATASSDVEGHSANHCGATLPSVW